MFHTGLQEFHPKEEILVMPMYWRQRPQRIEDASRCIQHTQKALTQMNQGIPRLKVSQSHPLRGSRPFRFLICLILKSLPRPTRETQSTRHLEFGQRT